ncbi:cytochrome P450 [Dendryphion nanum]|uniref:Cytochrome P450 n=1 Tax=Dendryphion nanum TaxID=256645 RepID=A0A9P9EDH0_9PLEO|nr:cytochrome P450 [Dendryphion nanum]
MSLFPVPSFATFACLIIFYLVTKYTYRLFFHPLAHFPGPKLAAATTLHGVYWDIFQSGLVKELPKLHEKYGPVIRMKPNELHVATLEGYNQIHRVGTPFQRIWHDVPFLTGSLQSQETLRDTKTRKEFLSPFFSKAAIVRAEPILHRHKLTKFLSTLSTSSNTVVDLFLGFRCLTADTIMDYCFQADLNALDSPGFQNETVDQFIKGFDISLTATYFPNFFGVLNKIILALPDSVRAKYFAPVYGFQTMQKLSRDRVEYQIAHPEERKDRKIPTMFDAMLAPDVSRGQRTPEMRDMIAEGCLMIAAGTDTTANVLGLVVWHVTQDREIERKLVEELRRGIQERDAVVDSSKLEGKGFEYLRAVVKEGLRLGFGVPGQLARKTPMEGARFGDVWVPGNTAISSCIYMQNIDAKTFPDPFRFDPERWLANPETVTAREKQMLSFSRGSRSCIGINLAYATLHLTTAHLFRRFEITTTGYTTAEDMIWNDRFLPAPQGRIRGLVKERKD